LTPVVALSSQAIDSGAAPTYSARTKRAASSLDSNSRARNLVGFAAISLRIRV
jgi:hypothetical protein